MKTDPHKLYFAKVHPDAIIPTKKIDDAGYDVYARFDEDEITINPGEIKLIPTGIATAFSPIYGMIAKERGSTGSRCMAIRMGVIDASFRGEIVIGINNTGKTPIVISKLTDKGYEGDTIIYYPYTKAIAQVIMVVLPVLEEQTMSYEELKKFDTNRSGAGLHYLGSSGK